MLKRFRISNFKTLVNAEFVPAGLNLIVGANNTGKTSLCQALTFLSWSSRASLYEAALAATADPWNLLNLYTDEGILEMEVEVSCTFPERQNESLDFSYSLRLSEDRHPEDRSRPKSFAVETESLKVTGGAFDQTPLILNESGKVRLLNEKRFLHGEVDPYMETTAPTDSSMLYHLYDLDTSRIANFFKKCLGSWCYYSLDPHQMRESTAYLLDQALRPDGSNLSSVLYAFHNMRPRDERLLVDTVRSVEPRLDLLSFFAPDPEHVYMFFEDKDGIRFPMNGVSDGTLRFLALSLLLIMNRGARRTHGFAPLIMVEEPENGLFVELLKPLVERMDPSGEDGQFVFTSHNPYFIDLFDGNLDGLHVTRRLGSYSAVKRPDMDRVRERLGKFSLGELHFRGLLE